MNGKESAVAEENNAVHERKESVVVDLRYAQIKNWRPLKSHVMNEFSEAPLKLGIVCIHNLVHIVLCFLEWRDAVILLHVAWAGIVGSKCKFKILIMLIKHLT